MSLTVMWFKRDLRLTDHEPLNYALETGTSLLLLYVVEPALLGDPHYRGRHWHFIAQSLADMNERLGELGCCVWVLEGEVCALLTELHRHRPITQLISYEETGLEVTYERDRRVLELAHALGFEWLEWPTNGIERKRTHRRGWNARWNRRMAELPVSVDLKALQQRTISLPDTLLGRSNAGELT